LLAALKQAAKPEKLIKSAKPRGLGMKTRAHDGSLTWD